jgi:PAS domain S-box-containing protein
MGQTQREPDSLIPPSDPRISHRLDQLVSFCSVLSVAFGLWVLTGWMLHIQIMKSILPGQAAVKANAAVCFILIGFTLWILRKERPGIRLPWLLAAKIAAGMVGLVGALSLLEGLYGWDLGIDQLLFPVGAEDIPGSLRPGLMSPVAAFGCLGLGPALLLLNASVKLTRGVAQLLPCCVASVALFGILDYVLHLNTPHTYISPITAFVLLVLSSALLFARTEHGLGALIASATLGGTLTRRLLPGAVAIPIAVGCLRWQPESARFLSEWTGLTLITVFTVVLLTGLTVWTGFVVDRSDWARRRGEETISRLASIVNFSSDGIIGKTIDGIVTTWNPGAEAIYGYTAQEVLGQSISMVIPPGRRGEFDTIIDKIRQGELVSHYETERLRKDGQTVFVSLAVSPVKDKSGKLVGVSTIARDISERKQAQEKLLQASLYARSLIEASLDPLVTISKNGKIMDANRATELATGVERAVLIGSDFSEYFTDPEKARQGYEQVFAREMVRDYALAIRHVSGRVIEVLYNASVFKNEAGEVEGVFAAARDVTERKRAERALRSLSGCNEALVRATDESSLLQRICDLVVGVGAYRMAWVGYADHDESKTVRPVAESGFEAGYLDTVNIIWADEERGRGPTGTAIRTGMPSVCHDVMADDRFAPWRENALRRGYRASLVLPLKSDEEVLGAISIYATEAGAFDSAEQHLLEELASNLTYGITALRVRAERRKAEEEIRKLNRELEERVQQRTAELQESERRVRRKLEGILTPEGSLENLELADLLDLPAVQSMAEDFYELAHVPVFILDLNGNPLVASGWQEVCTKFHRLHPDACKNCIESDLELSTGVTPGEFKLYKCKNNLWDVVTPITVGGQHVGNLFSGQFFFADEAVDYATFRAQAKQYGFDEQQYLAALNRVPRLSREAVDTGMTFLVKFAQVLSQTTYSAIKLARSITETSRVNAELAASVKELEAFTYSVSHDLRAPLRHISGFSKILTEEYGANLPLDAQHHLQRVQEGTRRMGVLVDDLLNLARVGRRELTLQVAGLKSIVEEVIAELAPECAGREIEWQIGDLSFVECDPGLIKQVFHNLLSNAVKFTRPRSNAVIEIGLKKENETSVVYVRDNGVGFSMKYADKLFGVFQRLHRAEDFEGTGVGLATVQRIVQKHGGRIWADAGLDKGATFYFTLGVRAQGEFQAKTASVGDPA